MSAIFGIHNLSGSPVLRSDLESMSRLLVHRGSDYSGIWNEGSIGLGSRLLRTTVESTRECPPFSDSDDEFVITADARLDNRAELIKQLSRVRVDLGQASDSELLLASYKHWGELCPTRLLGDFAFAIWDRKKERLFCARDHFGVRPFYFYLDEGETFVFASEIKAILAVRDVPCVLNETRVADHLSEIFEDNESTFYRHVFRLAPSSTLSLSREQLRKRRYWALDPSRELRLSSNQEYAEAFREVFTEAVSCRLRSASPVGSMLSGGLDSSSITCVARRLLQQRGSRLHTFSTVFDDVPDCDERQYINAVLRQDGIDPHFINGDRTGPFRDIDEIHWHEDQAFFAPNFAMVWNIYRNVAEQGIKVLLDGHDGDSVVSHGYKYLDELALAGRWFTLARELKGLAKHYGESPLRLFRVYASNYGVSPFIARHDSLKQGRRIWRALKRRLRRAGDAESEDWKDLLNSSFAAQTKIAERRKAWRKTLSNSARSEREGHYRTLAQPIQACALEVHDNAAAAFSIEKRYPFWDRRVVEFCLSLPPEQKMNCGWTRVVMRRAMTGILPEEVQWRGGKMDFTPSLRYGLKSFERELLDSIILHEPRHLENYVNLDILRRTYRRFLNGESQGSTDIFRIWKCASLALWLRQTW